MKFKLPQYNFQIAYIPVVVSHSMLLFVGYLIATQAMRFQFIDLRMKRDEIIFKPQRSMLQSLKKHPQSSKNMEFYILPQTGSSTPCGAIRFDGEIITLKKDLVIKSKFKKLSTYLQAPQKFKIHISTPANAATLKPCPPSIPAVEYH
jgi:hypothetical protein